MRLRDLEPRFLSIVDERTYQEHDDIGRAQGIMFLCPKCFAAAGNNVGVHSVICWTPGVPADVKPGPGRWAFQGTGYDNLSLVAGSSSVALTSGCMAHFFVTNGEITGV